MGTCLKFYAIILAFLIIITTFAPILLEAQVWKDFFTKGVIEIIFYV